MNRASVRRVLLHLSLLVGLMAAFATPASAGIWLGSHNVLRLGHNLPSGASQSNKKTQIRNINAQNHVNLLQEIMVTDEMFAVRPGSYYFKVSGLKGSSSYKEAYGFVINSSVTTYSAVYNYPNSGFERAPSAILAWHGSGYVWLVNYHALPTGTANGAELEMLNQVYNYFRNYLSSTNDVIIAGDFNRTATSSYFNNLKNAGCNQIQPNVGTSIGTSGQWANPYDHFAWNPSFNSVSSAARHNVDPAYWRANVSDHGPIRCWVNN